MQIAQNFEQAGDSFFSKGNWESAAKQYSAAQKLNPNRPMLYLKLGRAFMNSRDYPRAEQAFAAVIGHNPPPEVVILYAHSLNKNGKTLEAEKLISQILVHPQLQEEERYLAQNIALMIQTNLGNKDNVIELAQSQIAAKDDSYLALKALISYKNITEDDLPLLEKYEKAAEKIKGVNTPHDDLFFALALAFDQLGDYKKAAKYLKRGNGILSSREKFNPSQISEQVETAKQIFTQDFLKTHQSPVTNHQSPKPIFIIGMPRSSTSLVEQILASHSKVFGAGELVNISNLYNFSANYIAEANEQKIQDLTAAYLRDIPSACHESEFFTDKMPQNFLYLGLISLLFPNAKIINCQRDMRDVAISIYMNNFSSGISWANNLADIEFMSSIYNDIMRHWQNALPTQIYNCEYSNLIENPKQEIKSLLAYCDLDFEDSCLDFHKTKRPVLTASKSQVKKPIFKSSAGRWKNYEPYFSKDLNKISILDS